MSFQVVRLIDKRQQQRLDEIHRVERMQRGLESDSDETPDAGFLPAV